jgi:hypothetical protein
MRYLIRFLSERLALRREERERQRRIEAHKRIQQWDN